MRCERSISVCARLLNDYELITGSEEGRPLRPQDTRELHFFESNPLDHVGTSARRRESGGIDS